MNKTQRLLGALVLVGVNGLLFQPLVFSQTAELQTGIDLYGAGRWNDAIATLRQVQGAASADGDKATALYWLSLAELAGADFEGALRDISALELMKDGGDWRREIPYHKGRTLFYLGRYDEALVLLKSYADQAPDAGSENSAWKSAALYWAGECLYALGHFDQAQDIFFIIVQQYPQSAKYEAASYRIALINQRKIEAELLDLLKLTHEESLKTIEEYQRRERAYDQAIIAYQKRIAALEASLREATAGSANK